MKKAFFILFVLILACGTGFYFGWVQFIVPAGHYGVMISKTGGVNTAPIEPGVFRWQWELLLPTNVEIHTFKLAPVTHSVSVSGTLPSGALYARMIEGTPDFSWQFSCDTVARVSPSHLVDLVEARGILEQQALDDWTTKTLADRAKTAAETVLDRSLSSITANESDRIHPEVLAGEIADELRNADSGLEIVSVSVQSTRFPDLDLYRSAAETYETYQTQRRVLWNQVASESAGDSVSDYLAFERYARWGELLTRYPVLIEFFTSAGPENHPLSPAR